MSTIQPHDYLFENRRLEQRIVRYLVGQGRADLCTLKIRARAGKVRVRGQLVAEADRIFVIQGVRRVAGVLEVEDEIQLKRSAQGVLVPASALTPPISVQISPARLRRVMGQIVPL